MRRLLVSLVALLAIGACGQKGPLYLSDSPPPGSQPSPSKTYKPVPYPERPKSDGAQGQNQN